MAESPKKLKAGTIFETEVFNLVWKDGQERFSFLVPDDAVATVHKAVEGKQTLYGVSQDPTTSLRDWALTFVGREWDRDRLAGVSIRVVNDRIECRMAFNAPWWLPQALDDYVRRLETSPAYEAQRAGARAVPITSPMARGLTGVREQMPGGVREAESGSADRAGPYSEGSEERPQQQSIDDFRTVDRYFAGQQHKAWYE